MITIRTDITEWLPGTGGAHPAPGIFVWPEGVRIEFPNGDVFSADGGYNADGDSIDYNPGGRGAVGSPCHQALVAAGLL